MEGNSCGYAELVSDRRQKHCPECGSTDITFESDPMADGRAIDATEAAVRAAESIAVPKAAPKTDPIAPSPPVRRIQPIQYDQPDQPTKSSQSVPEAPDKLAENFRDSRVPRSRSGSRLSNMDSEMQLKIVVGLIGFILMMSGIGVLFSSSFVGGISLIIIGFIIMVGASGGKLCCWTAECSSGC